MLLDILFGYTQWYLKVNVYHMAKWFPVVIDVNAAYLTYIEPRTSL